MENNTEMAFQIILLAGNGRSSAMEAIQFAKDNDFNAAQEKLAEAASGINKAHNFQTKLLQAEAQGKNYELNLILIHSQDHLMNAITIKDMANEFIDLYQYINEKG